MRPEQSAGQRRGSGSGAVLLVIASVVLAIALNAGSVHVPLLGGFDYVSMYIYSTSATTAPGIAGQYPTFEIAWISL